jgi:hypothetical protein
MKKNKERPATNALQAFEFQGISFKRNSPGTRPGQFHFIQLARGASETVVEAPQVFVFQRYSRTVMFAAAGSIEITWYDSRFGAVAEKLPFIGESTRKTFRLMSAAGPAKV